jgi:F-type H+-transporting ATPase subunit a
MRARGREEDLATDPIHQFQIQKIVPIEIGGLDLSFTNSSLFMVVTVLGTAALLLLATQARAVVPGRFQAGAELLYEFVAKTLRDAAGSEGMKFFPFVFSLFMFILVANLLGMVPYFFTVTSHVAVTGALAVLVIAVVVIYGIKKNGFGFFKLFVPSGVPALLLPFVTVIEVISFLSRPLFAGFIVSLSSLGAVGVVGAILPLIMTVALTGFEFFVAAVQAYVFALLTCLYLNDALHPGH